MGRNQEYDTGLSRTAEGTSSKFGIFDVVPISLAYKWHMSNGERDDKRI